MLKNVLAVLLLYLATALPLGADADRLALVLDVEGPIGPATSHFIAGGLKTAEERDAVVVILRMDTPGGLDSAMRDIIKDILASPVPVATWVGPDGARAASAGTYILYASHVAAMAPATNLGAATPVQIGGGGGFPPGGQPEQEEAADDNDEAANGNDEAPEERPRRDPGSATERKVLEDAVSYIRGLAELRGRNADWAEKAVREAASASSSEALELGVIEHRVSNLEALLEAMDGQTVQTSVGEVTLDTAGATLEVIEPDWRTQLLSVLTNPNVAYMLMLIGIYGIIFELMNPGSLVPGVLGAICLLLALFAFQALPISYAGMALILLGLGFMVAEAFAPSFGILGIGGVIAFILGSIMLFDTDVEGFQVSLGLIVGFGIASLVIVLGIATMALRAWRRPRKGGRDSIVGARCEAVSDFEHKGKVRIQGELWNAFTDQPVKAGQALVVVDMEGLNVKVAPAETASHHEGLQHT
ncbi:NfeD family protein [Alkalilimnicola ehrlichii MLHE-1]|uniref:Nodulation efficiency protein NfeD n=1 Tax=Alkalilimnicola ehrlichii (strain ATCC BAA-1101 / DSM 17681 / MLHE-1) TaxID=187272 RepID=Q0A756_ALKEH|nr:Nodulation efficiency protein NfeD [Alkalilimnicola ehrlichii MLHE-1]